MLRTLCVLYQHKSAAAATGGKKRAISGIMLGSCKSRFIFLYISLVRGGGRVCLSSLKRALYGGNTGTLAGRATMPGGTKANTHDNDNETSVPFSFFGGSNGHCICSPPWDVTQLGHGQCVSGGAASVLFVSASRSGCWLSI